MDELDLSVNEIEIPGLQDDIEDSNRPNLQEGNYLAVVLEAETKINEEKGSIGFNWKLGVNPDSYSESLTDLMAMTWPETSKLENAWNYTYLGRWENGKIVYPKGKAGFSAVNALKAMGETGNKFSPQNYVGNVIRIFVRHKVHHQDEELDSHLQRWVIDVAGMYPHLNEEGQPQRVTDDSFE